MPETANPGEVKENTFLDFTTAALVTLITIIIIKPVRVKSQ